MCVFVRACMCVRKHTHPYTHIYGRMHTNILTHTHTLGRERVISKSILLKKKSEKRMRASKPQPVLADCKGLSVTAVFYWAKGKQQDSTWGPVKGYSSWKSALAHGLECGLRLISWAVGVQSIFTGCATPAGTAMHADATTHSTKLVLKLSQG